MSQQTSYVSTPELSKEHEQTLNLPASYFYRLMGVQTVTNHKKCTFGMQWTRPSLTMHSPRSRRRSLLRRFQPLCFKPQSAAKLTARLADSAADAKSPMFGKIFLYSYVMVLARLRLWLF